VPPKVPTGRTPRCLSRLHQDRFNNTCIVVPKIDGHPKRGPCSGNGYSPHMDGAQAFGLILGSGLGPFPGRAGFGPCGGQPSLRRPDNDEFVPYGGVSVI
jgi:hypothetical protein